MSRYLTRLARETHAKLKPPAALRLIPRAPATLDEIYEEQPAPPSAAVVDDSPTSPLGVTDPARGPTLSRPRESDIGVGHAEASPPSPNALNSSPRTDRAPMPRAPVAVSAPATGAVVSTPTVAATPTVPATPTIPAIATEGPISQPRTVAKPIHGQPRDPRLAPHPKSRSSALQSEGFDAERPVANALENGDFAIPESVVNWLRPEPDRPARAPTRGRAAPPVTQPPAPQSVIDVNIGTVEVIIDSDAPPPRRSARPPELRAAQAAATPPRMAGRLARQYLDR